MYPAIICALVVILLAGWILSARSRLSMLNENVGAAMNQLGVQLASRFDALNALLSLARVCAAQEVQPLIETVRSVRCAVTAYSTPQEVLQQETVLADTLDRLNTLAARYPALSVDAEYQMRLRALECYGKMIRTSSLIYNDSAARFNRALCLFPTCLIAGLLGFHERAYLELPAE